MKKNEKQTGVCKKSKWKAMACKKIIERELRCVGKKIKKKKINEDGFAKKKNKDEKKRKARGCLKKKAKK